MATDKKIPGRLLKRTFFEASPEHVAPLLLGKVLAHRTRSGWLAGRIVEVEAYLGPHHEQPDPAAHSHRGPTPRTQVLFGPAGHAYVYQIYGLYYCMNITCEKKGEAGSLLIRALEPVAGREQMARNRGLENEGAREQVSELAGRRNAKSEEQGNEKAAIENGTKRWGDRDLTAGPSRLCQALGLTRTGHNGLDVVDRDSPLQVWDDGYTVEKVLVTRRIGIRHAAELPLRFAVPENAYVSGAKKMAGHCIFPQSRAVTRKKPN